MWWRAVGAAWLVCGLVVGRVRADQPVALSPADHAAKATSTGGKAHAQVAPRAAAAAAPVGVAIDPVGLPAGLPAVLPNPFAIGPRPGGRPAAEPPESEASEELGPGTERHNLVFLELGGNAILYSINYDRALAGGFTVRVGLGHLAEGANPIASAQTEAASQGAVGVPLLVNYVRGSERHRLELGVGVTLLYASARASTRDRAATPAAFTPLATALIGYRYVPRAGGFTYRAGFTPLVSRAGVLPWGGFSLGYLF